jgi:hypothetical protein
MVVFIERSPGGRRIAEVLRVTGYDAQTHKYQTEVVFHA